MTDVVFLHPIGLDSRAAGWLALDGVIAPTLPGHGVRDRPRPGLTLDDVADEIVGWTDRPVHLIGASFGGMVAMHVALRHPERVASLALCFTTARVVPAGMLQRADDTERLGSAGMVDATMARWFSPDVLDGSATAPTASEGDDRDGIRYARESLERSRAESIADVWRAIAQHDVLDQLGELRVPTTCIAGERDASTPLAAMAETAAAIPDARLVTLDLPHMGFLERPDVFASALQEHLERAESAA